MRLTNKLLSFLNRAFSRDPARFLALRLSYSGQMTWTVREAVLTTTVVGGPGQNLTVDLSAYTLVELVDYLSAQPGYSVLYADFSELSTLSARVLIDGTSSINVSNGDHLYGYTSLLWSYLEAFAVELQAAADQIAQMLRQMNTQTAEDIWLDELGGYYGIPRNAGELDGAYGNRIIVEVLRPRGNNVAIENAIKAFTGQDATVTDVVIYGPTSPLYNSVITHNSAFLHDADAQPLYGLFDIEYGYDLINGGDFEEFQASVSALVGRLRDAGTHLRALLLKGSALNDSLVPPTDGAAAQALVVDVPYTETFTEPTEETSEFVGLLEAMTDALVAPGDAATVTVDYLYQHDSTRTHNGSISYTGGLSVPEAL